MQSISNLTRHSIFLIFLLTLFASLPVGLSAYINEPDGYNNINWGTDIAELKHMKYIKTDPDNRAIVYYAQPEDTLVFGNAILKGIEYGFVDGKFFRVVLKVSDILNYVAMKNAAFERFGEGNAYDHFSERYFWEGKKTSIKLVSAFDIS